MDHVHIVMRAQGEYDDYEDELVVALSTKQEANECCRIKNNVSDGEHKCWNLEVPAHLSATAALGLQGPDSGAAPPVLTGGPTQRIPKEHMWTS